MGMDVYGKTPVSERGEYFRNNIWWWRPLWDYCEQVAPELCTKIDGHTNSGDGLNDKGAKELGKILLTEVASGRTELYQNEYRRQLSELPLETCNICDGTGIRTNPSPSGEDFKLYERELEPDKQILYGRTHGWCNGCDGAGTTPNWMSNYPFSVENVIEFAEFLLESGGFEIH